MSVPLGKKNLWARNLDRAIYLPSVQSVWAKVISASLAALRPNGPMPSFFGSTDFLNFLLPLPQSAFWWPRVLYSPGHAPLNLETMRAKQKAVLKENRHPRSVIVSDSGGYQVATNASGAFQIDWDDQSKADTLRKRLLDWQSAVSEWGMILDIPSYATQAKDPHPFFGRDFQKCLDVTAQNIRFLVGHRYGSTKFMNVIQGGNTEQANQWYETVKEFPLEGWALPIAELGWGQGLRLLRRMLDEKKLDNTKWIHFLGVGTAHAAVGFTAVKRALQGILGDEDLEVSFDTASPFRDMARYRVGPRFERRYVDRLAVVDRTEIRPSSMEIDSEEPFLPFYESPVTGCGLLGDRGAITKGEIHLPTKDGDEARFDDLSLTIIAVQNIWNNLAAIADAHDRVEGLEATARAKPFMGETIPDLLDAIKTHYEGQQELKGAAGQIMALLRKFYEEEGIPVRLPHGGLSYTQNHYDKAIAERLEWALEMGEVVRSVFMSETPGAVLKDSKDVLAEWL